MSRYLVQQTAHALRERAATVVANGEPFPTESDLIGELDLSRTTIREAISRLEAEGVLQRRHGSGTTVNTAALEIRNLLAGNDVASRLGHSGLTPTAEVTERGPCLIDETVAEQLGARAGDPAWRLVRLWELDDGKAVVEVEHLLLPTWPMTIESQDGTLAEIVQEIYGEPLLWVVETADAAAADPQCAGLLGIESGSPVLVRSCLCITSAGRRVAHINLVQRPGVAPIGSVTTMLDRAPDA